MLLEKMEFSEEDQKRFWKKVKKSEGCWEWTAALNYGYGVFGIKKKTFQAHRLSFGFSGGIIPKGMTLDHLCRNRCCVNPDHMEVVTRGENVMRGIGIPAQNARKEKCPVCGDKYDTSRMGHRSCKRCADDYTKRYREENRKILRERAKKYFWKNRERINTKQREKYRASILLRSRNDRA